MMTPTDRPVTLRPIYGFSPLLADSANCVRDQFLIAHVVGCFCVLASKAAAAFIIFGRRRVNLRLYTRRLQLLWLAAHKLALK